jgi:hypothetical protein
VLAATETVDMISTYQNMTHKRWLCGYDSAVGHAYRINGSLYAPNTGPGADTIPKLCGPSPYGQNENYAVDVVEFD